MNILYLFDSLEISGAPKISVYSAIGIKQRGHIVYVISRKGKLLELLKKNNIVFLGVERDLTKKSLINFIYLYVFISYHAWKHKIDIIHTNHRWLNLICYFITVFNKKKLIWRDHSVLKGNKLLTFPKDKVISVCEACKKHMIDYFDIPEEKIEVIYNTIPPLEKPDNYKIEKLKKEIGIKKNSIVSCTIARLCKEKGHEYLINSIPIILKIFPNAVFLIVGSGYLKNKLIKLSKNLSLYNHVYFLGERQDISVILTLSDLMILPSLSEGLNVSILEAFSLGIPVVTTNVGGNSEIVINERTGFIVEAKNSGALANAAIKMISNKIERKKMGNRAKNYFKKKFDFNKMILDLESLYIKLLSEK